MLPEVPKQASLLGSIIGLLLGLCLVIYPVVIFWEDPFVMALRPGGQVLHLVGWDAKSIALVTCCLGLNWILGSIRNLLQLQTKDHYNPKQYPLLSKVANGFRIAGIVIFIGWGISIWIR